MFNQIIAAFQGFFNRGFWFGSFLPTAIFGFLNLAIAAIAFPKQIHFWEVLSKPADAAAWVPISFAAMVVVGYVLSPLIPLFRGWLDGSLMPGKLNEAVRRSRLEIAHKARDEYAELMRSKAAWERLEAKSLPAMWTSRTTGQILGTATDVKSVDDASQLIVQLRERLRRGQLPSVDDAEAAVRAMSQALEKNAARLSAGHSDFALSKRLEDAQLTLVNFLGDARNEAGYRFGLASERNAAIKLDVPQATRVGDARTVAESYSLRVYGVEFAFIWPRLQLVLPEKNSFADKLTDSKAEIDFAILCLVLAVATPVYWIPYLALTAKSPWLFLTIGLSTPLLIRFFYELVVQSQLAFAEAMQSAIDKFRLDVLTKMLLQPTPATRQAERELWQQLRLAEVPNNPADVRYRVPMQ
jgi:hypothetical protein